MDSGAPVNLKNNVSSMIAAAMARQVQLTISCLLDRVSAGSKRWQRAGDNGSAVGTYGLKSSSRGKWRIGFMAWRSLAADFHGTVCRLSRLAGKTQCLLRMPAAWPSRPRSSQRQVCRFLCPVDADVWRLGSDRAWTDALTPAWPTR